MAGRLSQSAPERIEARPGTYVLVLRAAAAARLSIGKLGELALRRGIYCYVGSAFGPGGLRARIAHHARPSARPHWHIDYLRPALTLEEVWFSYDNERHEHRWAGALAQLPGARTGLRGFGASDCKCLTHLIYFQDYGMSKRLARQLSAEHLSPAPHYSTAQADNRR